MAVSLVSKCGSSYVGSAWGLAVIMVMIVLLVILVRLVMVMPGNQHGRDIGGSVSDSDDNVRDGDDDGCGCDADDGGDGGEMSHKVCR